MIDATKKIAARPVDRERVHPRANRVGGFTLIEVLVAMMVLAIGMLGIAAMQLRGLQYSHDAYLRSQVSVLAYGIADRMRLNQANAATYIEDYTVPVIAPTGCDFTASTIANDKLCWYQELYNAMPPGSTANITDAGGNEFDVELTWTDRENNDHEVTYRFQP